MIKTYSAQRQITENVKTEPERRQYQIYFATHLYSIPNFQTETDVQIYYFRRPFEKEFYSFTMQTPEAGFEYCISMSGGHEIHQILQDLGIVSDYRKAMNGFDDFSIETEILTPKAKDLIIDVVGSGDIFTIKHFLKKYTGNDPELCNFTWGEIIKLIGLAYNEARKTHETPAPKPNGDDYEPDPTTLKKFMEDNCERVNGDNLDNKVEDIYKAAKKPGSKIVLVDLEPPISGKARVFDANLIRKDWHIWRIEKPNLPRLKLPTKE